MATKLKKTTLGLAFFISGVPTSASEFDEMAGEVGSCLNEAVDNVIYRQYLSVLRPKIVEAAEKEFEIPRKSETVDGSTIYEKDKAFIDRLLKVEGVSSAELAELAQTVADGFPFTVNTTTSGRLAKRYLDSADQVIEHMDANENGDYSKFVNNITSRNPNFLFELDDDGAPTRISIGQALKCEEERAKRESANSLFA
tara:strand:+ start:4205 stop:4798 length:594 start_codon:yes stop_codon:yes gene_type:complete